MAMERPRAADGRDGLQMWRDRRGHPIRDGPPVWGLDEGLTTILSSILFSFSEPVSLRSVLMLSSHLLPALPSIMLSFYLLPALPSIRFLRGFLIKTSHEFHFPTLVTCPAHAASKISLP